VPRGDERVSDGRRDLRPMVGDLRSTVGRSAIDECEASASEKSWSFATNSPSHPPRMPR
jgi:hypothetical protein